MRIIFVDGYNVLNSWPNLKQDISGGFESTRKKLIDIMHNYGTYNSFKVYLVFDGYKVSGNIQNEEEVNKNLTIVYTKDGETADSYIERTVHQLGRRSEIFVVTSDWLEQQTIFQRGAVRMSSMEFYNEVLKMDEVLKKETVNNRVSDRNELQNNIDKDVLSKLERMRRGH